MKYILSTSLVAILLSVHSQNITIDSLRNHLGKDLSPVDRAYTLDELSFQWFRESLDSSLAYGRLAYEAFEVLEDPKGLSQASTSVAVAFHYLIEWDSAEWYYDQALTIRRASGDTVKTGSSLNNLGVMYIDREDYNKAIAFLIEAMETRELIGDTLGSAKTKINLGLIFKKQGMYEKAIANYLEAKEILLRYGNENGIEIVSLNLGSIYNSIGDFEKGFEYNRKLQKLTEKRGSQRNLAKSYVNMANSFQGLGQLDSSLFYVSKAMVFFEEKKDTLNIAHSLLSIASFHHESLNYENAIAFAERLQKLNEVLNNRELIVENQFLLSRSLAKIGKHERARNSLEKAFFQKDSLLTESLNEAIANLNLKYESERKEREISELKFLNQEVELSKERSSNQRNIFLLIASLVILAAFFLIVLLRAKSRANRAISKSLSEKEVLLREIHHRVKNNLQVISSLLSLQSRYIEDEAAQAAVNEGQNRVKSMALIHQKLYQNNNLLGVEVIDYIKNLTATLKDAYGIDEDRVSINYELEDLKIDVDTIIPIGLILNELISNSFKYAFPNDREGTLKIVLRKLENELELRVTDDGVGSTKEVEKSNSFGMRMIQSLALKLEAKVSFNFDSGADASLLISSFKLV
ncbi:MAG: histidine kinase dimerization/phosphoacceptor domain -containing protein [Cyclobacteriaceae bacterium]